MRRVLPLVALAGIVASSPAPVMAQGAGGGSTPVLFEPFDWGPNAAWRRQAAAVRSLRAQLLRQGDLRRLNTVRGGGGPLRSIVLGAPAQTAVTGAYRVPVIPIAYANVPLPYPSSEYQCLLFSAAPGQCAYTNPDPGPRPYSVSTLYEEMSQQRISLNGVVVPLVRLDSSAAYYTDDCYGIGAGGKSCLNGLFVRMRQALIGALDSVNRRPGGETFWGQFDNDGPDGVPDSGDDDGVVDFVTFLQPEVGGECQSNPIRPTGIWSHRYVISALGATGFGAGFITRTPWTGHAGQFIRVNDYTIQSAVGGTTSCDGAVIMGVGTVAHETGHAFGLPDLYDTSQLTQGIGGWGLMGSGNYARPYSPASYDAWSLQALGWATLDTLGASRMVNAGPRLFTDTVFVARTSQPDEYLLIENRQAVRSDTAHMNPALTDVCPVQGFCAKSPGLLLWLINETKVLGGLFSNTVNVSGPQGYQGVALLQADGLNELRLSGSRNRGDRGDAYPGISLNTRFSLTTLPVARTNTGAFIGFSLDQIQQLAGGRMQFRFTRREPSLIQTVSGTQIQVNGVDWPRYEDVVPGGESLALSAVEHQVFAGGKSRARFLAWSNGGPRTQTIISNPLKPDTLSASFATEHRLRVTTVGGGSVTSAVQGDLPLGVFLTEGAMVTLTASTPQGFVFTGWTGDTVTTQTELRLEMRKGWDVEARFIAQVTIVAERAVSHLLGTPTLAPAELAYLDELGNRNGSFDVGDLLAMYRRQGLAVPPALLRRRP